MSNVFGLLPPTTGSLTSNVIDRRSPSLTEKDWGTLYVNAYQGARRTGVFPVGPIAVTCNITSPSFAHAKCGVFGGSE